MPEETKDILEERYQVMLTMDRTADHYRCEIEKQRLIKRNAIQQEKIARMSLLSRQKWIKEEAAHQIREAMGIKTIPGFVSKRETAYAFKKRIAEAHARTLEQARQIIAEKTPEAP